MKRTLYLIYILIACLTACDDFDEHSSNAAHTLRFSQDTLRMDTLLTGISSSTRTLKIYNRNKQSLLISSILLADAHQSGFRINVDGIKGTQFTDVEIAGGDSLYLFVEATLPPQNQAAITLIRDSILFETNGVRQEIKLWAYAQDALLLRGKVIERDTLIASERPLLIYDSLSIARHARLTLAAGTRLYFHDKAGMQVHGQLSVQGTLQNPVVFRGDRTDRLFSYLPYDRLPGQWGGIRFYAGSYDNRLNYAAIHGGTFGIRCDSSDLGQRTLTLENSVIHQVSTHALHLTACQALIGNCELSNAGDNCVLLSGGDYTFIHCTLANYFNWTVRRGAALCLQNERNGLPYPLSAAIFRNCLIAGSGQDELNGIRSKNEAIAFNYYFSHCLIHSTAEENDRVVEVLWKKDDHFMQIDNHTQLYDFRPDSLSKAIHLGKAADAQAYPTDRYGISRLSNKTPDAGCYEAAHIHQ